jgi:hypothetical protein
MHPYATDSDERNKVLLWLAALSMCMSWLLHVFFQKINFTPPWWSDIPSFVGFYEIFLFFFEKRLWKISLIQKIGLVKVPNLSGKWDGYILSSYDHHEKKIKATIEIFQTWTKIKIILRAENSVSYSQTASLLITPPDAVVISYEYSNEPVSKAVKTMNNHRGMARHNYVVSKEKETLNGEYFTGRGRMTHGSLIFRRDSSK